MGDLTDVAFVDRVTAGIDAIVHLAATPDPGGTWEHLYQPNVQAVTNLLNAAAGRLGAWLAPEDLQQLVLRSIDADVAFGIFHGISANTRSIWDIKNARTELGYAPVRDSEVFSAAVPVDADGGACPPFR